MIHAFLHFLEPSAGFNEEVEEFQQLAPILRSNYQNLATTATNNQMYIAGLPNPNPIKQEASEQICRDTNQAISISLGINVPTTTTAPPTPRQPPPTPQQPTLFPKPTPQPTPEKNKIQHKHPQQRHINLREILTILLKSYRT